MKDFVGLLSSEFQRALSRRLFRFIAALALFVLFVAAIVVAVRSSSDANSGLERAREEIALCERQRAEFLEQRAERFPGEEEYFCPSEADLRDFYDKRFHYADILDVSRGIAFPLFALSLLIGASFVGAEWGTGSLATLLTWEPRRGRVLLAKVIAIVLLLAVWVAAMLALVAVVFYPVAAIRGTTAGVDAGTWATLSGVWLRAAALAMFAGAAGAGLATITRNTAGGIGAGLIYSAAIDPLLSLWRQGRYMAWLFSHLFPRLLGLPVDVPQRVTPGGFPGEFIEPQVMSPARPLLLLSIYAVGLIALAYASFRARDVT